MNISYKSVSLLAVSLLLSVGCASKQSSHTPGSDKPASVAYTPQKGSAERAGIIAGVHRAMEKQDPDKKVVLVVTYLKVNNGWAWIRVAPERADGSEHYESQSGLLQQQGTKWTLLEWMPAEEGMNDRTYFQNLKKKYPAAPADIFPL